MSDPIQIESPQANINRVRFAGHDFFTFVDDIVSRIQVLFVTEFNDFVSTGTGQMLIDIVSWSAETLSFYIDRNAAESYLATARVRKSINRLARQNGYKPYGALAASVDMSVTLEEVQAFDVPLPEGFQFQGPNGLIFEAVEEVIFPTGEGPTSSPRTVGAREGVTREEVFAADGSKNLTFRLNPGDGKSVGDGTVTVTVAGAPWVESKVITFDKTDQYELDLTSVPPLIRFGDAQAGNVPAIGDEVRIVYVAVSGRGGLVNEGTIDDVVAPLVVATAIIGLSVTNPLASSAGDDEESTESVRANAPGWFSAREVAVTAPDYRNLSQAFSDAIAGTVSVAQAFVATSADDDFTLQLLLDNIRTITGGVASSVQASTAQISLDTAALEASRVAGSAAVTDISTAGISGASATARSASTAAQDNLVQIGVDGVDIQGEVTAGKAVLAAMSVGADSLSAPTKAVLDGHFDIINAEAVSITSDGSSTEGSIDAILSQLNAIDSEALIIDVDRADALTELDTNMAPLIVSIDAQVVLIDAAVATGFETAVETELQAIFDHVDGFLSEDCQANLVQIPILTRDVNGFLQAPSIALIQSLQTYLRERNDVTHVVEVVSGDPNNLVLADIVGVVGIVKGAVHATVVANVNKAIEDLLRVREFDVDLRLSDIYSIVVPDQISGQGGIAGVKYANFEITGDAAFLDVDGDLIVGRTRVITRGTISLTGVTATT